MAGVGRALTQPLACVVLTGVLSVVVYMFYLKSVADSAADNVRDLSSLSVARRHAGFYMDKKKNPDVSNVLLVVAGNWAYRHFLRNWECHAAKLGLDYVVLSLDEYTHAEVGPERSIEVMQGDVRGSNVLAGRSKWREPVFNVISTMKVQAVVNILESEGLDVIFSDCDHVFARDPLEHESLYPALKHYDFLYAPNWGMIPENATVPGPLFVPEHCGEEGNTGFYYVTARNPIAKRFLGDTVKECNDQKQWDDQTNMFHVLTRWCNGGFQGANATMCAPPGSSVYNETLSFCNVSPYAFPTGWVDAAEDGLRENMRNYLKTFHANMHTETEQKKNKLKKLDLWVDVPTVPDLNKCDELSSGYGFKANTDHPGPKLWG